MSAESERSSATRPSLLARLRDWSQQTAWREFDHDYAPLIRQVARKAGLSDPEADDVVQETLLAVAKQIAEFKHAGHRGSFRAWFYQQARWRIADQFRKRRVQPIHSQASPTCPRTDQDSQTGFQTGTLDPTASAFEKIWDQEWLQWTRQVAIARVKRRVSARQYQLFDLHALQGLSVQEAASVAGSTVAAVYMARSRVQRLFDRELREAAARVGVAGKG